MKKIIKILLIITTTLTIHLITYAVISSDDPNDKVPRPEWNEWVDSMNEWFYKTSQIDLQHIVASRCEIYGVNPNLKKGE